MLTGSANAVVPKGGSEAYDVSKAAINHLVRELAVSLGPLVRVNAIAPATVVAGSAMFPRDRVIVSLQKYKIAFADSESTEDLRSKLAEFYAQRTITKRPILPIDNANAICFLAENHARPGTKDLPSRRLPERSSGSHARSTALFRRLRSKATRKIKRRDMRSEQC